MCNDGYCLPFLFDRTIGPTIIEVEMDLTKSDCCSAAVSYSIFVVWKKHDCVIGDLLGVVGDRRILFSHRC